MRRPFIILLCLSSICAVSFACGSSQDKKKSTAGRFRIEQKPNGARTGAPAKDVIFNSADPGAPDQNHRTR